MDNPQQLTNEEKRVIYYTEQGSPTIPSSVTCDTPLYELNLNWRERDLPERERTKHVNRLHPYLGKFIPQLVEIFLRKYFKPGQTICDPFAGSGTTLVQANELGINAIGYDISAFNVLLIEAKTKRYDLVNVKIEILDILDKVSRSFQKSFEQLNFLIAEPYQEYNTTSDYLRKWYAAQALQELLFYRDLIPNYANQEILKIILSRSARSARLTTHFDLDFPKQPQTEPYWCYKHSRTCKPTTNAYQFLRRYSLDTIQRLEDHARVQTNAKVEIHHADSRYATIPPIDGVLTSPPYVGLIDYHEQHRYAYELLGLIDRQAEEIGAAIKGSSQKAKVDYQLAITQVFSRVLDSMVSGSPIIVVAGDKYFLYEKIGIDCNVNVEAVLNRHVNRRTGRRTTDFFESVFIWRKR